MAFSRVHLFKLVPTDNLQPSLFESGDLAEDMRNVLVPTRSVSRYSRTWRLSTPIWTHKDRVIGGRIGFDASSQRRAIVYDESQHDFIPGRQESKVGTFVHYAIHCDLGFAATEISPPEIRANSVRGALQEFMQTGSHPQNLNVDPVFDTRDLYEWISAVDRVASITANMERANPTYRHKNIEDLFVRSGAEDVSVEASAPQDGTLALPEESPLYEYTDYAEDGHGSVLAAGSVGNRSVVYRSGDSPVNERIEIPDDADVRAVIRRLASWISSVIERML